MDTKETTDLAKTEPGELQVAPASPLMGIIAAASTDGNVDADKLMKLLEANERYEANEARKAFHVAMAGFQKESPKILKDAKGHNSSYAKLPGIIAVVAPILSKNGLSHTWVTKTDDGIEVTCKITHLLGHSEETSLSAAPDKSGSKNDIQAVGSTITYLQRYTLKAALGLAEADQGDDGAGSAAKGPPEPTPEEQEALQDLFEAVAIHTPGIMELNKERFAQSVYAQWGYPHAETNISSAAKTIIEKLTENDGWETVCQKL